MKVFFYNHLTLNSSLAPTAALTALTARITACRMDHSPLGGTLLLRHPVALADSCGLSPPAEK
ncbi:hypothetical protein [Chlorobium phaeovibrioides]|uniref:hypothetical protein n=1 Tax=Chlorobium phaeovibrioides TaxID=1094 RepID=UPI001FD235EC|nr:hypothetical protein [Chlorobium phaeovibrioides]